MKNLLFFLILSSYSFNKVIIWGHKLHSHTHSYIHNGFFRAFNYLGYRTLWLDSADDVSKIDTSNALYITEGQVDKGLPIHADSFYVLHNCDSSKPQYKDLKAYGNYCFIQVYVDSCLRLKNTENWGPCIYASFIDRVLYMPWATDLLPYEIEENKHKVQTIKKEQAIYWIGSLGGGTFGNENEITPFVNACKSKGIKFQPYLQTKSVDDNIQLIQKSYLAPAIQGTWQVEQGYVPCRIFKNISYGAFGLTNSYRIYELFNKKIIYNSDTYQLFFDGVKKLTESNFKNDLLELMDFVKDNHTYINRINTLLEFIKRLKNEN